MRVTICVKHNALMEAQGPISDYLVCYLCKDEGRRGDPNWFPAKFARRNHQDHSGSRVWVAMQDLRFAKSGWSWVRIKEGKEWKQAELL